MRRFLSVGSVFLFLACAYALPVTAQTSVGFADPNDISNLLDYRLPKWGYRIWDADFGLGGNGTDMSRLGVQQINNRFSTNLGTTYQNSRESEQSIFSFGGSLAGRYQHAHAGEANRENSSSMLDGNYRINGTAQQYLGGGPVFLQAALVTGRFYSENKSSRRIDDVTTDYEEYYRSANHLYDLGLGVGHLRNVVPLIRAERLSERLAAIGRGRLAPFQVQKVADVLAKEYGYRRVFDRSDRYFWSDVIEPMLQDAAPLTTYEIFYLTDVLNEDVGLRYQGWQLSARFEYQESIYDGSQEDIASRQRSPLAALTWYHNLTLNTQIHVDANWRYIMRNWADLYHEYGELSLRLGHLWNLSDRHLLENVIAFNGNSDIDEDARQRNVNYRFNLTTYIENRLSLETYFGAQYNWMRHNSDIVDGWTWSYGIYLRYHLDRVLF